MRINSFSRIEGRKYLVQIEGKKRQVYVKAPKGMDHYRAYQAIFTLFAHSTSLTQLKSKQPHSCSYGQFAFESRPLAKKWKKKLLSSVSNLIKQPIKNPLKSHWQLIDLTSPTFSCPQPPTYQASLKISNSLFNDPFTTLATIAHQQFCSNFSQKDHQPLEACHIRQLADSDPTAFALLPRASATKASSRYLSHSDTVRFYYQMLQSQFEPKKISYVAHHYGLCFERMIANDQPLTAATIYRMNIGLANIEIHDVQALQTWLQKIAVGSFTPKELKAGLYQWASATSMPLHYARGIQQALSTSRCELTLSEVKRWLKESAQKPLWEQTTLKQLHPDCFDTLMQMLSFSDTELERLYTGLKIDQPIGSAYTNAGQDIYKPWVDQQELLQIFPSLQKSHSWEHYHELLAHIVCKKHLVHPHPTEVYRVGMIIPAPATKEGKRRWYRVSSCINNRAGNFSYTLKAAARDNSLPAIKLFRSTASSPYAVDGQASVLNDLNPLNIAGYKANKRIASYEKCFFAKRTIPFWVGYNYLARQLLAGDLASEGVSGAVQLLSAANSALLEDFEREKKVCSLAQIIRDYDDTILNLLSEVQDNPNISFSQLYQLQKLIKCYTISPEPMPLQPVRQQRRQATMLKRIILQSAWKSERASLYKALNDHIFQPDKLFRIWQKERQHFNTDIFNRLQSYQQHALLAAEQKQPQQAIALCLLWSEALANYAQKKGEAPKQKTHQNVHIVGHSLGSALAQCYFAKYTLGQGRLPLPQKHFHLYAYNGPGIAHEDVEQFMLVGAKHSQLLQKWNRPFTITQRFEAGDCLSSGGQRHLGGCSAEEEETARQWLNFDGAVQEALPQAKAAEVSEIPTVHATRFEGAQRAGFRTCGRSATAADYQRIWIDARMQYEMDLKKKSKFWPRLCEILKIDPIATLSHPEEVRSRLIHLALSILAFFRRIALYLGHYLGFHLAPKEPPENPSPPSLFGPWQRHCDPQGSFVVTSKGVKSRP